MEDTIIGLAVSTPKGDYRVIITGFKSVTQAIRIGLLRRYVKETVSRPRVVINPNIENYDDNLIITQEMILAELKETFDL